MSVPEASVNENDRIVAGKENVWSSNVPAVIFSESEAGPVNRASQNEFGLCVLAVYERHVAASLFRCKNIHREYCVFLLIKPFWLTAFQFLFVRRACSPDVLRRDC